MKKNENKKEFIKQRIQLIGFFTLAIAFIYNFSFDIIYTQRALSMKGYPIISGGILTPILFLFFGGALAGIFYTIFIVNNKKILIKLGNFFFYSFIVSLLYGCFDITRLATYYTRPFPKIYYISYFISQTLGIYKIIFIFILIYFILKIIFYIKNKK